MPEQDASYPMQRDEADREGAAVDDAPRAGRSRRALLVFAVVALAVLAADLALKYAAFHHVAGQPVQLDPDNPHHQLIPPHDPITVVPGILSLRLTTNTGAVFGVGKGGQWLFILVSVVAVGVILHLFWRSPARARVLHLALALILAGALGNLYDRLKYSAVRDMLYLFPEAELPFGWRWPRGMDELWPTVANSGAAQLYPWVFNLADAALLLGVVMIIAITWWRELRGRIGESARD
ncbi:MAG: signal peptidase II [Phycisphaeraceae bacterium]